MRSVPEGKRGMFGVFGENCSAWRRAEHSVCAGDCGFGIGPQFLQNLRAAIGTFGFNLPRFARADSVGAGGFFGKRGRVFYGLRATTHVRVGVQNGRVERFAEIRRNGADEPRGVRQQKRVLIFFAPL